MTRREVREQIFTLLFSVEFHEKEELPLQRGFFMENDEGAADRELTYIRTKFDNIIEHLEEIDKAINEVAKGWKTTRMGKVDLTLIRLAVFEIKYEEDIPTGVAINEAVELAKKFGTDESPAFVNGILAKLA